MNRAKIPKIPASTGPPARTELLRLVAEDGAAPVTGSAFIRSDMALYLTEINRFSLLSAEEERELGWKIINDDCQVSRDRMVSSNLRLVVLISKGFVNRGLTLADLIEEGNVGLIRAVDGFDPAHGARFSTYASWWIKQAIKRALMNSKQPVHIPAYMIELITQWKFAHRRLESKLGASPSLEELAAEMDLPLKKIRAIVQAIKAYQAPSQGQPDHSGEPAHLTELVADTRADGPDERMLRDEQLGLLRQLLETIDQREASVIRLRFGLEHSEPLTLEQVADQVGLSRERVRQIVDDGLAKLNICLTDEKPNRFIRTRQTQHEARPMRAASAPGQPPRRGIGRWFDSSGSSVNRLALS